MGIIISICVFDMLSFHNNEIIIWETWKPIVNKPIIVDSFNYSDGHTTCFQFGSDMVENSFYHTKINDRDVCYKLLQQIVNNKYVILRLLSSKAGTFSLSPHLKLKLLS